MDSKKRCQSCGMPVTTGYYGTNADGSDNPAYCTFCFKYGNFTKPRMTLDQMIGLSVDNMTSQNMGYKEALSLANEIIPRLARWS